MCRASLRFPHLSFIPPVPYSPLRGTFPSRGRLYVGDINTLIYDTLETIFSLSFIPLVPYPARSARHLPLEGEGFMSGIATLSYTMLLRRSLTLFHTASTLSGSLRSPPSPRGEGFVSGTAALSQMPCFHSAQPKTALRGRALQSGFWFYYSTVTDFARFLGLSTSFPLLIEV